MNLNQCFLGAILMAAPSFALADAPQNYWGMGIDGVDLEAVNNRGRQLLEADDKDINGFNLRYGFWFPFDLLGVEVRVGNVAEETGTLVGHPELRYIFGLGKANIPFEKVNLYVMGGISKTYYDIGGDEVDNEDVVAGVGIELMGTETTGLTLEILKFGTDDDNVEGELITLGFNYRFELPGFR